MNKVGAAVQILRGIGAPVNSKTVGGMIGWFNAEGGNWGNNAHFNPLNTTLDVNGAPSINSAGVKSYRNWGEGINATVQTLRQANMSGIVQAFRRGDPQGIAQAIGSSPWGTDAHLVAQTIGQTVGQRFTVPSGPAGIARAMSAPTAGSAPQVSGGLSAGDALAQAMLSESAGHIDTSGKVNLANPLTDAIGLMGSSQGGDTSTPTMTAAAVTRASGAMNHEGDVNPLQGFQLGRTDMGVDANARPGTPILAPNKAQVIGIMPNWYQGQPYVAVRLLAGPNAGKIMYVAEQISRLPRVGQVIQRGQPIAVYANSGTGIEIGWANTQNWQQTLAQSTGQLGTGDHSNAPAGQQFRNYLTGVGA